MSKIISCLPALYSSASPVSCLFGTQDICQDFFVSNLCLSLDKVMFKVMHKQYYINQAPKSPAKSSLQRSTQAGSTLRIRRLLQWVGFRSKPTKGPPHRPNLQITTEPAVQVVAAPWPRPNAPAPPSSLLSKTQRHPRVGPRVAFRCDDPLLSAVIPPGRPPRDVGSGALWEGAAQRVGWGRQPRW